MILIKQLRFRNFLSYGNTQTTFQLNRSRRTLIKGKNGSGKSSIVLDTLMYALYDKPYRAVNKAQMINSINKRDMTVEVDFSVDGVNYSVHRGMKPSVFDIFCEGQLVEQDAAKRDYQAFLETQILKVSEKTFKQIAVLGSASYVPFMQLTAAQRRELIESILDIEVFSHMNAVLKDRVAATKEETKRVTNEVAIKKSEAVAQQKLLAYMKTNTEQRVAEYEQQKVELNGQLQALVESEAPLRLELDQLQATKLEFDSKRYESLCLELSSAEREVANINKRLKSIGSIDECPTCLQKVTADHVHSVGAELNMSKAVLQTSIDEYKVQVSQQNELKDAAYAHLEEISTLTSRVSKNATDQATLLRQIGSIDASIKSVLSNTTDVSAEQERLKEIGAEALRLIERQRDLSEEKHLQDVAIQLLKDSGIKTAIVREYLPVLNQLINKYLAAFNFFVDFTLDENFDEILKSRGRDTFSYSSFSEGEKRKIDTSILLAFRQLAAMKNSAKTNVLIFDEILDGNLDLASREAFNEIVGQIGDANVFVISHADASTDHYDDVILVEKRGDFSEYDFQN